MSEPKGRWITTKGGNRVFVTEDGHGTTVVANPGFTSWTVITQTRSGRFTRKNFTGKGADVASRRYMEAQRNANKHNTVTREAY